MSDLLLVRRHPLRLDDRRSPARGVSAAGVPHARRRRRSVDGGRAVTDPRFRLERPCPVCNGYGVHDAACPNHPFPRAVTASACDRAHAPDEWEADYQALRAALAAMTAERDRLEGDLNFLRYEWSPVGAKACPACLYDHGTFIRRCRLHAELDVQTSALAASTEVVGLAEGVLREMANLMGIGRYAKQMALDVAEICRTVREATPR